MTKFYQITPGFYVAAQLDAEDIARAAELGFRTIINNRPDRESENQLEALEAEQLTNEAGLEYHFLPVRGFQITDEDNVRCFDAVLGASPEPVLAYCKSGTRSAMLWAQAMAGNGDLSVTDILVHTADAGFDLGILRDELEENVEEARLRRAA